MVFTVGPWKRVRDARPKYPKQEDPRRLPQYESGAGATAWKYHPPLPFSLLLRPSRPNQQVSVSVSGRRNLVAVTAF